jgi:hypothetical protein
MLKNVATRHFKEPALLAAGRGSDRYQSRFLRRVTAGAVARVGMTASEKQAKLKNARRPAVLVAALLEMTG